MDNFKNLPFIKGKLFLVPQNYINDNAYGTQDIYTSEEFNMSKELQLTLSHRHSGTNFAQVKWKLLRQLLSRQPKAAPLMPQQLHFILLLLASSAARFTAISPSKYTSGALRKIMHHS